MAVKRIYLRAGDPRVLFYWNQNIACFVYFCLFSNVLDILINNWLMKDWRFVNIQELVNIFLTCELLCWQRNVKETIEVKNKQTIVQDKKNLRHGLEKNRYRYKTYIIYTLFQVLSGDGSDPHILVDPSRIFFFQFFQLGPVCKNLSNTP